MPFKVVLRNIRNKEVEVEVEQETLVSVIVDKCIEGFKPDFAKNAVLLVFKGKVLLPEKQIGEYQIKEGDRIVVMSQKKKDLGKAPKKKKEKEASPSAAQIAASAPDKEPEVKESTRPRFPPAEDASVLETGEMKERIQQMISMGFEEEEASKFLTITNGDIDRATSLILEGEVADADVPEEAVDMMRDILAEQIAGEHGIVETEDYEVPEDHPLYEFTHSDVFQEMRAQIRSSPSTLPQFLISMFQNNPELVQVIIENEEDFLKCLLGPHFPQALMQGMGRGGLGEEDLMRLQQADQARQAELIGEIESTFTEEDKSAISRLCELGFPRGAVIEAYMACDRNEEAAANFLFDEF